MPTPYSVDFQPDWKRFPKLARIFKARPRGNVYSRELRELLAEARADAVRFVRDVRLEELARARLEELDAVAAFVDERARSRRRRSRAK